MAFDQQLADEITRSATAEHLVRELTHSLTIMVQYAEEVEDRMRLAFAQMNRELPEGYQTSRDIQQARELIARAKAHSSN